MVRFKSIWKFIKEVIDKFTDDKCPKLGAALSYYTIFAIAPIMVVSIAVASLIFGREAATGEIITQVKGLIGNDGAEIIQVTLKNAQYSNQGLFAILGSLIALIIGSTAVYLELQDSLNLIWKVKPKPGINFVKRLLKDRVQSFAMVLATGFLLLVSLVMSAGIASISNYISVIFFDLPKYILDMMNTIVSFIMALLLFMMIFKVLPDVDIQWKYVWVGAMVTSFLFVLGKYFIGLYIGTSTVSSTFGAAGSLVVLMLWVYYSAQIFFIGAEFTRVYTIKYGKGIRPASKYIKYDPGETFKKDKGKSA